MRSGISFRHCLKLAFVESGRSMGFGCIVQVVASLTGVYELRTKPAIVHTSNSVLVSVKNGLLIIWVGGPLRAVCDNETRERSVG